MYLYKRFTHHFLAFQYKTLLIIAVSVLPLSANAQRNPDIQLYYELLGRIELLEQEIRQLRGDLEVYQYRLQQGQNSVSSGNPDQGREYQALERRIEALEQTVSGSGQSSRLSESPPDNVKTYEQTPAPQIKTRPRQLDAPPSQIEQAAYNAAFNLLLEGRYERAITEFRSFLDFYPAGTLASDAYYWLGESYYVVRDFSAAEQIFLALGSRYPDSEKIPDALLKLGYLYAETGQINKARQVLQKLTVSYPESQAANLAEKQLRLLR